MSSANPIYRILVIDDTPSIHWDFRKVLTPALATPSAEVDSLAASIFGSAQETLPVGGNFSVDSAFQGEEGRDLVRAAVAEQRPYTLAFVDMRMPPGWDGLETIAHLWRIDPHLQIVICTAYSDHSWSSIHQKLGKTTNLLVLKKPFDHVEVFQLAHSLCEKWRLHRSLSQQLSDLDSVAKKRTADLQLAEERFRQAFDASPLAQCIQTLDDGRILEVNDAYEKILGVPRTEAVGQTPETFGRGLDPIRWQTVLQQLSVGQHIDDLPVTIAVGGTGTREMRCSARSLQIGTRPCAIWIIRDITQQLLVEQQLRQSQKLEAIGQLAAGIAHDFNNLLTVILNYAGCSLDEPGLPGDVHDNLIQVRAAAERAAALTRQLLVFSRQQIPNRQPHDLSTVVLNLRAMLVRLIPARIKLVWSCPDGLPIILADEANIEQVLLNLVVNARDAIQRNGRIDIAIAPVDLSPAQAATRPIRRPGSFLCLSVADTGTGIPAEVLPRIFDPFFTTKDVGQGTGLGLATVYSIAQQHHGWVEVSSTVGLGTRFEIYLPSDATLATPPPPPPSTHATEDLLQSLAVLYVEDDRVVRTVTQTMLSRLCASLTVAEDGPTALALWRSASGKFDLLITDMVMPNGLSGADLARRFVEENPRLKVVITSGYSAQLLAESEGLASPQRILAKPYDRAELLAAIRLVLASAP